MLGFVKKSPVAHKNYSCCSGCNLCLLVCPVWRQRRDISLTPPGYFKAMQHGIGAAEIAASIEDCTLCMACEPVCPENIDIIGKILELRRQLAVPSWLRDLHARMHERASGQAAPVPSSVRAIHELPLLLPDESLHEPPEILARVVALLGASFSEDDCRDITLALEIGEDIPRRYLERFLTPLRQMKKIVVSDGLLLRKLRHWLP